MSSLSSKCQFFQIELPAPFHGAGFVLFTLCESARVECAEGDLRVHTGERDFLIVRNPECSRYLLALSADGTLPVQDGKLHLTVELRSEGATKVSGAGLEESSALSVFESIQALPAKGMFSVKWASKARIAVAKKAADKPEWAAEDFPYSHFDGAAYLRAWPEVLEGVLEGKWVTGLEHFLSLPASSRGLPPISIDGNPNAGNLKDFVKNCSQREISLRAQISKLKSRIESFRKENGQNAAKRKLTEGKLAVAMNRIEDFRKSNGENFTKYRGVLRREATAKAKIKEFTEENELLLLQLHQVQEELESYFLKNKDLISERDELALRQASLSSERQSALEAAVKAKDEQAKLASERQSALEAAVKAKDEQAKLASERAARIAKLEAQVADQAEHQKQIDEQMIRAEAQLEMLKKFLQPAFQ